MPGHEADVAMQMELRLLVPLQPALPLSVTMRYHLKDPYAVSVAFSGADEEIVWVFARDLLAEGLDFPRGQGDVQIRPEQRGGRRLVMICLTSPDGTAELEVDSEKVREFVLATEATVPRGSEHTVIDLDSELSGLLS